jgi:hypothetical protein
MQLSNWRPLLTGLVLVAVSALTTGCAPMLSPYGAAHRHPGMVRPYALAAPVDPELAARGRWDNVMRLPRGAVIDVLTMDGAAHIGALESVGSTTVRVLAREGAHEISRADVVRVDLVDLPGHEGGAVAKQAGIGAALGLGAAALISGVIGGQAWPPPGVLLRGGAAIGGVTGGAAAIAARSPRLVYLAEHQHATSSIAINSPHVSDTTYRIARTIPGGDAVAVASLTEGELVRIVRRGGIVHRGLLIDVEDASLRLDVDGAELRVPRASIVRIEVLEEAKRYR